MKQSPYLGKYLSLPSCIDRNKIFLFDFIKKKRKNSIIQGWKSKFLSQTTKDILLKFVVLVMPTYAMSCFIIPKRICNEINIAQMILWWGSDDTKNKINWICWDTLRVRKKGQGLRFQGSSHFQPSSFGQANLVYSIKS